MTFISYAQNFEDVMLWRALKHVEHGFYVDIGANHPVVDSISKAFYDRGWRGIHVEPVPEYAQLLREARTDEVVIEKAVSAEAGVMTLHVVPGTGLSSLVEESARRAVALRGYDCFEISVPVITLDELLAPYVGREIHWLKIDVEGAERDVLRGWNAKRDRPWIMVVEATVPNSTEECHEAWEQILYAAGYRFVYFDGLSRFYVSEEHCDLAESFRRPPNFFDEFQRADLVAALAERDRNACQLTENRQRLEAAEAQLQVARLELHCVSEERQRALTEVVAMSEQRDAMAEQHQRALTEVVAMREQRDAMAEQRQRALTEFAAMGEQRDAIMNSTSWKLTKPLRKIATAMRVIRHRPDQFLPLVRRNLFRTNSTLATPEPASDAALPPPSSAYPTPAEQQAPQSDRYRAWIAQHERPDKRPLMAVSSGPTISVLVIATRSRAALVAETVRSLDAQSTTNWQLVLGSLGLDEIERGALKALDRRQDGNTVLAPGGGATLGAALRAAADVATGDFIMVLEAGDTLPRHAIASMAARVRADSSIDILYADEDVLEGDVRAHPQFKPEWSPELLTAYNYFGRPTVIRRSLALEVGSFAADLGLAAEWDLYLRATEPFTRTVWTPQIRRHPEVLCHRYPDSGEERPGPEDPASADFRETLVRHWRRQGLDASVTTEADGTQRAVWEIKEPPLVSVVIPSKNRADLLSVCLDGLLSRTAYPRIEIIIVDNGSTEADTLALYKDIQEKAVRVVPYNEPFNYSRACNIGAAAASGELLLFLNNDIEVLWEGWLAELVRYALRPGVGVVGTKLVYPNGVLQHAGVLVGLDVCGLVFTRAPEYEWGVFGSPSVARNCMGVMGACQLVRREVFERVGGFDEGCIMATSDVRLSLDAWRAGYRTVYAPHGKLVHHEGMTRGHRNPEADVRRTAAAIRALGIEVDPYYHPGLSGTTPIPTLRLGADPSAAENLKRDIERRVSPLGPMLAPDLRDDAAMAAAAQRGRDEILWMPDAPGSLPDAKSAARFMIDLLRRRPDLTERYPNALSEGAGGRFAAWLRSDGLTRFGFAAEAAQSIDAAFRADLSSEARAIVSAAGGRDSAGAVLPKPRGLRELTRLLFEAVARGELSKEGAWWFLLETAEVARSSNARTTKQVDLKPTLPKESDSAVMLVLAIDPGTSIAPLEENLVEIADELRALNGQVLLVRRLATDSPMAGDLDSELFELTQILPVKLIEAALHRGIVAAYNEALHYARDAKAGVFLLQAGARLAAGSLSEIRAAANTDPMIGFVSAPTNLGEIAAAPLSSERVEGSALEAQDAYNHIHPYLPRISYVAPASGPCLYIKASMLLEFGDFDVSYATSRPAQDEFMTRCNLRGYRTVLANRAYVHLRHQPGNELAASRDLRRDYQRLAEAYPEVHRAIRRTLDSAEFKAKRLLAGLAPDSHGRRRVLFESSHLGCFFNGTFTVTRRVVTSFVEQFSSRYECWISCSAEALRFHGLDRIGGLHYAGELSQASQKGPYLAAMRLAQPFSLPDLVNLGSLAPLSGFLMLDTIAMDCQNLDEQDLQTVWSHMVRTVSMVGYISQFTGDQVKRRFVIPDTVAQATILLSTDPRDYVPVTDTDEPERSDHLLVVGNHYSHKHLRETIDLFRCRPTRPRLIVLGLKTDDEAGIIGYASGELDDAFVEELYRNAIAIVFPSHYEGFGLPVMHALGYRKPVFARAIPALEEIRHRAPGGSNVHLFESTEEIVDAALAGATWQADSPEPVDVQTWAEAARNVEALIRQAESKLSYRALQERVLEVTACQALVQTQSARPEAAPTPAAVVTPAAAPEPRYLQPSLLARVRRAVTESYLVRGARAWVSFKPGSRPHRMARGAARAAADAILRRPRLASAARALLSRSPRLAQRLISLRGAVGGTPIVPRPSDSVRVPSATSQAVRSYHLLSPEAQQIAEDLRRLIA